MDQRSGDCEAGYIRPLAPSRIPAFLALEVSSCWPSGASQESASTDRDDGARESELGEGRIADELSLKLGLFVDSRTAGKYLKGGHPRQPSGQRWATFIHNHASAIVACDFFTSVTVTFQVLYVIVAIEIGSRRILHGNVTNHPTAEWTRQQFREFLDGESGHRYLVHDRDSVFSAEVDAALTGFGLKVLKTPVRSPMANAYCERVIGTIRRECLDYLIPLSERHLKHILREFITHYNRGRPHSALAPGFPEPIQAPVPTSGHRHRWLPGLPCCKDAGARRLTS
jgi:putative transposase